MLSVVETLQLAIDSFNNIKMAIEEKGVDVGDTPKSEYNLLIAKIPVSSGGSEDTSELEARILELEAQVTSLTTENESLTSDKSSLLSQVNDLTVRNESLNSQVAQLNSDKTSLQSQIDSKDIEIQSKTATISTYTGYLSSIGTAIVNKGGTLSGEYSSLAADILTIPVGSGSGTSSDDGNVSQFAEYIYTLPFDGLPNNTLSITNGKNLFKGWTRLASLEYVDKIDMSSCDKVEGMFDGVTDLTSFPLYDFGSLVNADLTLDMRGTMLDLSTFSSILKKYTGSYSRKIIISEACANNNFTSDINAINNKNVQLEVV